MREETKEIQILELILKFIVVIFVLIILFSCQLTTFEIDPQFKDHLEVIEQTAASYNRPYTTWFNVIFVDDLHNHKGKKKAALTEFGKIKIDPEDWKTWGYDIREYVLTHEIGHLVFGLEHGETLMMNGIDYARLYGSDKHTYLRSHYLAID